MFQPQSCCLYLFSLIVFVSRVYSESFGWLETVAGTGFQTSCLSNTIDTDGTGPFKPLDVDLCGVTKIVTDHRGDKYFCVSPRMEEYLNYKNGFIVKWSSHDDKLSVIAGYMDTDSVTVTDDFMFDGMPGDGTDESKTRISCSGALAIDKDGDLLYVYDKKYIIKLNTLNGEKTTILGGDGTVHWSTWIPDGTPANEVINDLSSSTIGCLSNGDVLLYVPGLHSIYRLSNFDNRLYRVAGTGSPGWNGDGQLATSTEFGTIEHFIVDRSDNIYIADHSNHRVRKVDGATNVVSTIAGNGTSGFA